MGFGVEFLDFCASRRGVPECSDGAFEYSRKEEPKFIPPRNILFRNDTLASSESYTGKKEGKWNTNSSRRRLKK